ncbi:MAG: hypothetical protein QOF48_3696 [Verrucomicrobiota bacterium]|jgi:hypothetical protein
MDALRRAEFMKRLTILAILVSLGALTALGRPVKMYDIKKLTADAKLVFVGRVKGVKPSGITTSLSYPTWEGVVFEWLRVYVEVVEPIKGTKKGEIIQTAMLAVNASKGPRPIINAPGMLEPTNGNAFLFFLVPTTKTNLFAAITSPFDDDQAVFPLDRNSWKNTTFSKDSEYAERHRVTWSLVDDQGRILPDGADSFRKTYAKEIATAGSNRVVYLQWEKYTNPGGWSHNIPKGMGPVTNVNKR